MNNRHHLLISLAWLWLTMGLIALFVLERQPFDWLAPESVITLLEYSKLFFIAGLLPLLIASRNKTPVKILPCFFSLISFLILFLPLTMITAWFGRVPTAALVLQQLFLLFYGGLIICLIALEDISRINLKRWYYLFFFLLFGAGPVLFYLRLELAGQTTSGLLAVNPFWLISRLDQPNIFYDKWLMQSMLLLAITLCFLIARNLKLKKT